MAERNIKMNVKTDTGYDTLYPQTKADIVGFNDTQSVVKGKTVQENLKNTANALYHPNLFINGDFQCWQRGENITTQGYQDAIQYFADMWFTTDTNVTVKKVDDGLNLINKHTGVKQAIELKPNVQYTITYSINNNRFKSAFIANKSKPSSIGKVTCSPWKNEYFIIRIDLQAGETLNYVDLFEGDVAYPHVKEDYATALNRCQKYILYYSNLDFVLDYDYTNSNYKIKCNIPEIHNMYKTPTFTHGSVFYWDSRGNKPTVHSVIGKSIESNVLELTVTANDKNNQSNLFSVYNILLTCEPL